MHAYELSFLSRGPGHFGAGVPGSGSPRGGLVYVCSHLVTNFSLNKSNKQTLSKKGTKNLKNLDVYMYTAVYYVYMAVSNTVSLPHWTLLAASSTTRPSGAQAQLPRGALVPAAPPVVPVPRRGFF